MNERNAMTLERTMNDKAQRRKYCLPVNSGYFFRVAMLQVMPPAMAPTSMDTKAVPATSIPNRIQPTIGGGPPAYACDGVAASKAIASRAMQVFLGC